MLTFEKKFLSFTENNINRLFFPICIVLSLLLRLAAFNFISSDMEGFLLGWFGQIEQLGRFHALDTQVGNYSVLYQTLIAIMTYIPINPLYQYKFLSVIFDYLLAFGIFFLVKEITAKKIYSYIAFALTVFSPLVFINSAVWGQCDSIYTSLAIWSLYAFIKKKYPLSMILYGLSFAFKLQAIFLLPFYLFAYIRKKDFSIFNFLIVPATMEAVCIPAMIMGRGFKAAFSTYYYQTESCDKMYFSYPSFWSIFSVHADTESRIKFIEGFKLPAVIMAFSVLALMMIYLSYKKIEITSKQAIYISFIFIYSCVIFLPGMHERYGFMYEILAIIIMFMIPKTVPLCAALMCLSLITYGSNLVYNIDVNSVMGIINFFVYILYIFLLLKDSGIVGLKTKNEK
ncbi:MAG: hypothetical protein K5669_10560 [Lachnospiraceae bacterium]|nr:hypothetical protein [Lachnospiraceae bacterium]